MISFMGSITSDERECGHHFWCASGALAGEGYHELLVCAQVDA